MNKIKNCEKKLANMHNVKYCILTGRGATALWLAYLLIKKNRKKVIIPNIICPSVLFTLILADCEPIFVDVLERDSTLDPDKVKKLLNKNSDIGAVVMAHIYGYSASILEIKRICRQKKVILIEDAAQSFGGKFQDNSFLGSKGDVSILSFGHSKILDVGEGGALLTNNSGYASRIRKMNDKIKENNSDSRKISKLYKKLYYMIIQLTKSNKEHYKFFDSFPYFFKNLYIKKISNKTAMLIDKSLNRLSMEIKHRKKIYQIYVMGLKNNKYVKLFKPIGYGVPWRFSFRIKKSKRDIILEKIRKKGFDVSSWYPSIMYFNKIGRYNKVKDFVISNLIEKEVVNLWVTRSYSQKKAQQLVSYINKIL